MSAFLCNQDCNNCEAIENPQVALLLNVLREIYEDDGGTFTGIVNSICPNLTCCSTCHFDDFCHFVTDDGKPCCQIAPTAKKLARRLRRELGIGKRRSK